TSRWQKVFGHLEVGLLGHVGEKFIRVTHGAFGAVINQIAALQPGQVHALGGGRGEGQEEQDEKIWKRHKGTPMPEGLDANYANWREFFRSNLNSREFAQFASQFVFLRVH